ncbi:MAG: CBS domain-containing protein [Planctomycetota bacterium]|jgi:CBS domain-containing protein
MSDTTETNNDEFQDPLDNYDPRQYDDPLEEALSEQTVASLHTQPYMSVSPETPVAEAMQKLLGEEIACLLIEDEGRLVGVFSDRNVLDRVALEYDRVKDQPVSTVMTADPVYVHESDSAAAVLTVMAVSGFRHVPVVDSEEHLVGIVSPLRVTNFLRAHSQPQ